MKNRTISAYLEISKTLTKEQRAILNYLIEINWIHGKPIDKTVFVDDGTGTLKRVLGVFEKLTEIRNEESESS